MMPRFLLRCSLSLAALTACSTSSMQVPAEIETSAQKIDIAWSRGIIHSDPIAFAPYKADPIDIGWNKGTSSQFGVGMVGKVDKENNQTFSFALNKDGSPLGANVTCIRNESESGILVGGLSTGSRKITLHCERKDEKGQAIAFDGVDGGAGLSGSSKDIPLRFDPIFNDRKGAKTIYPLGYQLYRDGKPVAAIAVSGDKAYYVTPQNDARWDIDLAATAVALLIFEH